MGNVIEFKKPLQPLPEKPSERLQWVMSMLDSVNPADENSKNLISAANDMLCFLSIDLDEEGR